jgi:quercetin dioxygenase-like cupin family protein
MRRSVLVAVGWVALLVAVVVPASAEEAAGHAMITPDQIEWNAIGSLPPGAKVAVLEGDPAGDGPFTMRIEFPADYVVPAHTHPVTERLTVLSGTFYVGLGDSFDREKAHALPVGALAVMESGTAMFGFTGDEPTVIQLNGNGPWGITFLDPDDDPRKKPE